MWEQFSRTELLLGKEAMERLAAARVAVFGLGGVGGYAAEALARSGLGAIDLIDHDRVSLSNLNRQLCATRKTVGQFKADVTAERIREINPDVKLAAHKVFFTPETASAFDFSAYDYIVDAIDTVTGKIELAVQAARAGTPIISSMGAGNKLDPTAFEVTDLFSTSVCPLARVMRRELKRRGIDRLKVVYSREPPLPEPPLPESAESTPDESDGCGGAGRRRVPGSVAFVPSVAGLILAGEVVKDLIRLPQSQRS